ncbi:hypothetical protein BT96DRAFT_945441 [Gymnopus androsaceus JB14]|uniref:DUF6589 domain-containing protein n=1 Tax=Gymnopus androsaceus JB14 TaxID=1447944 RepID=A0A6A4H1R5_9AGAR|nr:hypothetical protein BT96DRAFT_945441 [Gymnopus androsaceus JB14]
MLMLSMLIVIWLVVCMRLLPNELWRLWLTPPLKNLQTKVGNGQKQYQVLYCFVLDNIQEFLCVWEDGIGLESCMICGCAYMAIGLEDCAEDAFDFMDRFMRILKNEHTELTVSKLHTDINWDHIQYTQSLHVLHALTSFVPSLQPFKNIISKAFCIKFAIHRMGKGILPEQASHLISWFGGDYGSVLAMDTAKKYLATMYNPEDPESDYKNLHNQSGRLTYLVAGVFRLELKLNDYNKINLYFDALANEAALPTYEWFIEKAEQIVDRYMMPDAYEQVLLETLNNSAPKHLKFPVSEPFYSWRSTTATTLAGTNQTPADDESGEVKDGDADEDEPVAQSSKEKKAAGHIETAGFTGDHVLANSILFMMEYSWWIEATYAIPEVGAGNTNYVNLLLEMYCLFQYKSSKNLKDAIWNNWLVNVTGELGKWIPDDLL